MLTIQDVGTEILQGDPRSLYVFAGSDWGIKSRYINILSEHYGQRITGSSVSEILSAMSAKRLVPLAPALYIVRYDEEFISTLNDKSQSYISNINIQGTIVCIYESSKHYKKCEKYLPNHTVTIDSVNPAFVHKYLSRDYPMLSSGVITEVVKLASDYGQADLVCRTLSTCPEGISIDKLHTLFSLNTEYSDHNLMLSIAAKDFKYLCNCIESYDSALDNILYTFLRTAIELDKCLTDPRKGSNLRQYSKYWSYEDVYRLFDYTYQELKRSRSTKSVDIKNRLIYLASLSQYSPIPNMEVLKWN